MALGKNSRVMDMRRSSSSYCSTVTLVVFVALCLVGVWMMTSSTVVPVENMEMPSEENMSAVKEQVVENVSHQFEDGLGDLSEDAKKGDFNSKTEEKPYPTSNGDQNLIGETTESIDETKEETKEENPAMETEDEKNNSESSKSELGNGENQNTDQRKANVKDEDNSAAENTSVEGGITDSDEEKTDAKGGQHDDNKHADNSKKKPEAQKELHQITQPQKVQGEIEEKVDVNQGIKSEQLPDAAQSELLNETNTQDGAWKTQAVESKNEKDVQKSSASGGPNMNEEDSYGFHWKLCNVTAGPDYIPCLDNLKAIKKLPNRGHYEHRERHCPEGGPTCLVSLPKGYRQPIEWPTSRGKIWYSNVPHTKLAEIKGHQNWVKVSGEFLTFPGGGTQFIHGATHYIEFIQESLPDVAWGKRSRVVLDVGCGVASFGGYLFDKDVLTMSFAPKDEHEAQVQLALERGIPAISAVMGTRRLPFPSKVFDIVHCARCRVPWHAEGGKLLLELNRVLRPGGYFVWSATPIYRKDEENVNIWHAMSELIKSMCWEVKTVKSDTLNQVGVVIYQKPLSNDCYEKRVVNDPPLCEEKDDPNAAWNIPLQACIHRVPVGESEHGSQWPEQWPLRLEKPPYWLSNSQVGVYGKAAPEDFTADYQHWKRVISNSYLKGLGIEWSTLRNVMDMRSVYGGFAAALRNHNLWVMNVVSIDSPDTLPIIFERGLFGIYHDWCESFSTYPRTYDLLHADHLFSKVKTRCDMLPVFAEVDRILRPEGKLIIRDNVETIAELDKIARSLRWEIRLSYSKDKEGLLCLQKSMWRPQVVETITSSIA